MYGQISEDVAEVVLFSHMALQIVKVYFLGSIRDQSGIDFRDKNGRYYKIQLQNNCLPFVERSQGNFMQVVIMRTMADTPRTEINTQFYRIKGRGGLGRPPHR